MKATTITLIAVCIFCSVSVFGQTPKLKIENTATLYQYAISFNPKDDHKVLAYLDKKLERRIDPYFKKNGVLDTNLTAKQYTFYMKASSGHLLLKFEKGKNSNESYANFKKMTDGIRGLFDAQ